MQNKRLILFAVLCIPTSLIWNVKCKDAVVKCKDARDNKQMYKLFYAGKKEEEHVCFERVLFFCNKKSHQMKQCWVCAFDTFEINESARLLGPFGTSRASV